MLQCVRLMEWGLDLDVVMIYLLEISRFLS